jgi:hypothetical protein
MRPTFATPEDAVGHHQQHAEQPAAMRPAIGTPEDTTAPASRSSAWKCCNEADVRDAGGNPRSAQTGARASPCRNKADIQDAGGPDKEQARIVFGVAPQ